MVGSGVSHLPLDNSTQIPCRVQVRPVCWPSNTMVSTLVTNHFDSVGRCQVLLDKEMIISIKLVKVWKHKVLYNLRGYMLVRYMRSTQSPRFPAHCVLVDPLFSLVCVRGKCVISGAGHELKGL